MKFKISGADKSGFKSELAIILLNKKKITEPTCQLPENWPQNLTALVEKSLTRLPNKNGKPESGLLNYPENEISRVLIAFYDEPDPSLQESFRQAAGNLPSFMANMDIKQVDIFSDVLNHDKETALPAIVEGIMLSSYNYDELKTSSAKSRDKLPGRIVFHETDAILKSRLARLIKRTEIICHAVNFTRDLANKPANHLTPTILANEVQRHFRDVKYCTVKTFGPADLKKMKMGAFLAVAQGSAELPRLIRITYNSGHKNAKKLLLVGKGVTFDSGGISIKPSAKMAEMKYDMAGAAAVIGVMSALKDLRPAIDVVALVPAAENLPDAHAIKPGDVITAYNGKTIEIIDTDAEGRLLLADSLAYGVKKYKPDWAIDLATLTGSVVVALGTKAAGVYSDDQDLVSRLAAAGNESGERVWPMPLWNAYRKELDSDVADLKNLGSRNAGSVTAAKFLQEFVNDTHWAHLDIAGTAYGVTDLSYLKKGASGYGVRLLLGLIRDLSAQIDN